MSDSSLSVPAPENVYTIPDTLLNPEISLCDAALALASGGFKVVPLTSEPSAQQIKVAERKGTVPDSGHKNPGGLLGKGWQDKSSADPEVLRAWFTEPVAGAPLSVGELAGGMYRSVPFGTLGVGVHAGPDIVIVDIDAPENVPPEFWEELERAPFQSSSARDERRGHYYFLRAEGVYFGQTSSVKGIGSSSAGELRHGTAIAVSAPSAHAKGHLGRRYQWMRAGVVPGMSVELANWLQSRRDKAEFGGLDIEVTEASLESIESWVESCTTATEPQILDEHLAFMHRRADDVGLHKAWLPGLIDAVQMSMFGLISAEDMIDATADLFVSLRTDSRRASLGGNVTDEDAARREYLDLLKWAVGKVSAKYAAMPELVRAETYQQVDYFHGVAMPAGILEALPEGVVVELPAARGHRSWFHPKEVQATDGRILVEATHIDIAKALAEEFSETFQWVQNGGGGGDGEWWSYVEDVAVWRAGGQRTSVSAYIVDALENRYAAYEVVDANKVARAGAPADVIENLAILHGPSAVYYRLTKRPGTHVTEIGHIAEALKSRSGVGSRREDFDNTGTAIAVANGLLDVKTRSFEASSAHQKTTKRMPVEYVAGATCPKFLEFLTSAVMVDGNAAQAAEVVGLIQRYMGAAILNDWTSDNFLMVHGPGGSGKSTVFEDIPRALFGDDSGYWSMLTPQVFTNGITEAGRKFELATVAGSRLLTCNEAFDGASGLDAGFLKGFTDGSAQRAAFKGRDNFIMTPGRLVFMSNSLPKMKGVDSGISRRAVMVEFPHGHDKSDPTLPDPDEKLFDRDIVPELPGILNWVIEGAAEYLASGLNPPTSTFETTREALLDSSPEGEFMRYFRAVTPADPVEVREEFLTMKDLHNLYRDYLESQHGKDAWRAHGKGAKALAESFKSTFRLSRTEAQRNVKLDDDKWGKGTPLYNVTANEAAGAFLELKDGVGAPKTGWMGMAVASYPRTRVGIPDVEEWRGKQTNPTAGTPLIRSDMSEPADPSVTV